jgi:hypothetical protein
MTCIDVRAQRPEPTAVGELVGPPARTAAEGFAPAGVVAVRIDPELRAMIEARAKADHTTTGEIVREAVRRFLDVA